MADKQISVKVSEIKPDVEIKAEIDPATSQISYKAYLRFKAYTVAVPVIPELNTITFKSDYGATDFLLSLYQKGYKFFDSVKYRSFGDVDGYIDVAPHPVEQHYGKKKKRKDGIRGKRTTTTTTTTTTSS